MPRSRRGPLPRPGGHRGRQDAQPRGGERAGARGGPLVLPPGPGQALAQLRRIRLAQDRDQVRADESSPCRYIILSIHGASSSSCLPCKLLAACALGAVPCYATACTVIYLRFIYCFCLHCIYYIYMISIYLLGCVRYRHIWQTRWRSSSSAAGHQRRAQSLNR